MGDAVRLSARSIHGRYATRSNAATPQNTPAKRVRSSVESECGAVTVG